MEDLAEGADPKDPGAPGLRGNGKGQRAQNTYIPEGPSLVSIWNYAVFRILVAQ